MKSKEALQHIINLVSDDTYYRDKLEEEFEILQRDLEVLNIIRKHLKFQTVYRYNSVLNLIELMMTEIDKEDYKCIKNWMQNTKTE